LYTGQLPKWIGEGITGRLREILSQLGHLDPHKRMEISVGDFDASPESKKIPIEVQNSTKISMLPKDVKEVPVLEDPPVRDSTPREQPKMEDGSESTGWFTNRKISDYAQKISMVTGIVALMMIPFTFIPTIGAWVDILLLAPLTLLGTSLAVLCQSRRGLLLNGCILFWCLFRFAIGGGCL